MDVPGFEGKPDAHDWCKFADLACGGCSIYAKRPHECSEFMCMWLLDTSFPDYWFPAKSKIVIHTVLEKLTAFVVFIVDPAYPTRWREAPYFDDIKKLAKAGIEGRKGQTWHTLVSIGYERIPIVA